MEYLEAEKHQLLERVLAHHSSIFPHVVDVTLTYNILVTTLEKKRRTSSRSKLFCSYKYLEKIVLQAYYIVSVKIHVITYSKSQTSQLNFIVVWPRYRLPTEKDKRIRIQYTRVSCLGPSINHNFTTNHKFQ